MLVSLKGSPAINIDQEGFMSITTTWMLIDDESDNVFAKWLAFQNEVEEWAGNIGDPYKRPIQQNDGREAFEFEEDDAFICQSIDIVCVDGRTHYEVTFTNAQNLSVMRQVGNVSVEVTNNNEITKSISYQIDIKSDSPLEIDKYLIESGTTVTWAGSSFLMENSSYQAQTKTRYLITFTAKDMAKMMIGNPAETVDAFGQRTRTAVWRYSNSVYESWIKPEIGSDASEYIGLPANSGFIINNINVSAEGVLGYNITFEARHVSLRHVRTDKRTYKDGKEINTTNTIIYQSTEELKDSFDGLVGQEALELGLPGSTISEVSVNTVAHGEHELNIVTDDYPDQQELEDQIGISMSSTEIVIEPLWCGWAMGASGVDYYIINFPPTTTFTYQQSIQTFINMSSETSNAVQGWTESAIIAAIKGNKKIGYDTIIYPIGQYTDDSGAIVTGRIPKNKYDSIKEGDITDLVMSGYVYAQPSWTTKEDWPQDGNSIRNIYFMPWKCLEVSPIVLERSHKTNYPQWDGRDRFWDKSYIDKKIPMFECSVSLYYRGNARTILRRSFSTYYKNAIKYVKSSKFTSYKGTNISLNETVDRYNETWTNVTCTIQALTMLYWNPKYDNSCVED